MSRDAEIILVTSTYEDDNLAELSFWLQTAEAVDPAAIKVIQEVCWRARL